MGKDTLHYINFVIHSSNEKRYSEKYKEQIQISTIKFLLTSTIILTIIWLSDSIDTVSEVSPIKDTLQTYYFKNSWDYIFAGNLNSPTALTIDSKDNIYVADTFNDRILKFDSNGEFITKLGSGAPNDTQQQFNNPAAHIV